MLNERDLPWYAECMQIRQQRLIAHGACVRDGESSGMRAYGKPFRAHMRARSTMLGRICTEKCAAEQVDVESRLDAQNASVDLRISTEILYP